MVDAAFSLLMIGLGVMLGIVLTGRHVARWQRSYVDAQLQLQRVRLRALRFAQRVQDKTAKSEDCLRFVESVMAKTPEDSDLGGSGGS